jgi:hypothetical protein
MTVLGARLPSWSGHSARRYPLQTTSDAFADRLPLAPLRVGLGHRDAGDVGADDGAARAHRVIAGQAARISCGVRTLAPAGPMARLACIASDQAASAWRIASWLLDLGSGCGGYGVIITGGTG